MGFTPAAYVPTDNISNTTSYPSEPATESAARLQFQTVFDQVMAAVNTLIDELENTTIGTSGAQQVGSAPITDLTGSTVYTQLVEIKAIADAAAAGDLTPGIVETLYLADAAVTSAKMGAQSVGDRELADSSIDTDKLADAAVTSAKMGAQSVGDRELIDDSIKKAKLHSDALAIIPRLDSGISIPNSSNLNSYISPNTYICTTDSGAASLSNCPVSVAFKMYVDYVLGNSTFLIQTIIDEDGRQIVRRSLNGGNTWSTWTAMAGIVYGTSATPPPGTYPAGTIYVQYTT